MTAFVALGMRSEGNTRKIENQQLVSSSRKCSSTPVGFGQGFLCSDIIDLAPADFYLLPRLKSALKGRRYCGATAIKEECYGGAEMAFTRWLLGICSTTLQSLAEVCSCTGGLL
jgi:hypothetical protein